MTQAFAENILEGKVAFICGGTRGMNFEIAKRYAEHGAKVAVMSRNEERCANAAAELKAIGGEALGLAGDARDYDRLEAITAEIAEKLGNLDIVVAGQAGNFYAPAMGMSSNGFRTVIDIDLIGTYNVFRASFEHLNKPGASLIAITASEAVIRDADFAYETAQLSRYQVLQSAGTSVLATANANPQQVLLQS